MSGLWTQKAGRSRVSARMNLESSDFGKLLTRWGYPDTLKRAPGKISGDAAWDGEPFPPDFNSMQGSLAVDIGAGQFAKIDPGAGRLLSILSLQSLSRRVRSIFVMCSRMALNSTASKAMPILNGVWHAPIIW